MADIENPTHARRVRRTQTERTAETTGKLLDAAVEVLLEKGYSGFRIGDAASRAGVSRGGQLHHFASKNELIEAALSHLFVSEINQAKFDAAQADDKGVIHAAYEHAQEFLSSNLFWLSFNMLVSLPADVPIAEKVRGIARKSRAPIEDAWRARVAELGVHSDEARDLIGVLWSVQRGMLVENKFSLDGDESRQGLQDFVIDLLDSHLRTVLTESVAKQSRRGRRSAS